MGERVEWYSEVEDFGAMRTTITDTYDALRTRSSYSSQNEVCNETYFDGSALGDPTLFDLFGGDLQTIEKLPEESLAGVHSQAPPTLSSSSSNSSSITPPQSTSHHSMVASLPATQGFPLGHYGSFREYPPPHDQQSLISSHTTPNHYGLGIGLPTHVPGMYGGRVQVLAGDNYKVHPFDEVYGGEEFVKSFQGTAASLTPCPAGSSDGEDEAQIAADLAYSKALERCLKTRDNYTMSLKEIYAWVRENTTKVKDPTSRGWQNSVRHNLSMNGGFEKVPSHPGQGAKKGGAGLWRLTADAIIHGVRSTTRFRKPPVHKASRRTAHPAPKRQASGRKGGQATRDAGLRLKKQQVRSKQATSAPNQHLGYQQCNFNDSPYSFASSASSPAFNSVSTPNTPYMQFYPHDMVHRGAMSFTPTTTQAQPLAPTYSAGYAPVEPAIGQYSLRHIDPTYGGIFRNYDTDSSPFTMTTPDLTSDASPGSFYPSPCNREESVEA